MTKQQKRYYSWRNISLSSTPERILRLDIEITRDKIRGHGDHDRKALLFDMPRDPELYFNMEVMYMLAIRLDQSYGEWAF